MRGWRKSDNENGANLSLSNVTQNKADLTNPDVYSAFLNKWNSEFPSSNWEFQSGMSPQLGFPT